MKIIQRIIGNHSARFLSSFLLPKKIKKILKKILVKLNIYDKRASFLGLNCVFDDDIFIVSYPRSGNTWIRFLIAYMLNPKQIISFKNIGKLVPDIHRSAAFINNMQRPRLIKSHDLFHDSFSKMIYVYRDGRDVMVSYYYYAIQSGLFKGGFSDFLRSNVVSIYGHWHEHVSKALKYAQENPNKVLVLQYEKMQLSLLEEAHKIVRFCQFSCAESEIEAAVKQCSFDMLKQIEKSYGPEVDGLNMFRSGSSGQWKEMFSPSDMKFFLSQAESTLNELGYIYL